MPRRRAALTKLSRRRVDAPPRPYSPELPFLVPPRDAAAPTPTPADHRTGTGSGEPGVTPDGQTDIGKHPPATLSNGSGDEAHRQGKRPLSRSGVLESAELRCSPASDGDQDLLLSLPSTDALKLAKGDVVFFRNKKLYHPALVTRFEKKKPLVKFIYDLVKFKKAWPFPMHQKSWRRLTYEEKVRCRAEAQTADPQTAEMLLLALEALEEYEAMEPVDDPEEFFKTQCDYIVRLRSASESPTKYAVTQAAPVPPCPLLPRPLAEFGSAPGDDDGDSDVESLSPSPRRPPTPPPPLPPHLREEQRAYAARLLEVILSDECGRHLRAVHAGRVPSWRQEAFRRGSRRHLLTACSLGDLETCPELACQARREALRQVEQLKGSWLVSRRQYAEEVLAPEAALFAISRLSDQPLSSFELDAELSLCAPRFRP